MLIDFSTIQSQVDSRFAPQGACIKSLSQRLGGMATPVRKTKGEISNNNLKGRIFARKKGFSRLRTKKFQRTKLSASKPLDDITPHNHPPVNGPLI